MIIGIDPGITGAIAVLDLKKNLITLHDMPTQTIGKRQQVNAHELAAILRGVGACVAYVERVGAMPKQGVSSMFNFGETAGVLRGVLAALEIQVCYVTPQKWKKATNLIGKEKDEARTLAIQRWPEMAHMLKLKKHCGRADAALIALVGNAL